MSDNAIRRIQVGDLRKMSDREELLKNREKINQKIKKYI